MAVSTPAAVGTGSALALGPQALTPAIVWLAKWISTGVMPLPTESEATSLAVVTIFVGGGVVCTIVTLVRWIFKKHHIIEENGNGKVHPGPAA